MLDYPLRQTKSKPGNCSDLGVCPSSMPVNPNGRVAIRVLSRRSRGDFQPIDAKSNELLDLIPLAPFSWPGEGGSLLWGTPPHPPSRASPSQPFPGFPRSDVLACGGPSLVRYYALTEQAPLNLNTYQAGGPTLCGIRVFITRRLRVWQRRWGRRWGRCRRRCWC